MFGRDIERMQHVIIVIHLMLVLALIGVVLLQRSEGGGLGIGSTGAISRRGEAARAAGRRAGPAAPRRTGGCGGGAAERRAVDGRGAPGIMA